MLLPTAKVLILEEIEDGFFLDRFSESGQPLDDSWHDSLGDALGQARLEYEVTEGDWVDIPDDIINAYDFLFPRQGD